MKQTLKRILERALPAQLYATMLASRARSFIQKQEGLLGLTRINQDYESQWGRRVRHGPFAGMVYTEYTSKRHICQRLIGCYEEELHPVVESWKERNYRHVYDIGCAEGYYAVGVALTMDGAQVTAFDTDPWARKACWHLAQANQVTEKVTIEGFCDQKRLQQSDLDKCLLILDCEGYEDELLNDQAVKLLGKSDILVEIHNGQPTTQHPIAKRFEQTHWLEIIVSQPRDPNRFPEVANFSPEDAALAVSDMRHEGQGWFWLRTRNQS